MYLNNTLWTHFLFYGSIFLTIIIFIKLIDKERLYELLPIGLFIAVENYTLDIIGLQLGYWKYPLESPGYPEVTILSSLIFFPLIAMIFAQYLSKNLIQDIKLIAMFVTLSMVIEIISIKTTRLFVYQRGFNLFIAFLIYLIAYILIILFQGFYTNLKRLK